MELCSSFSGGRYSVLNSGHLHIRNVSRDDSGNLYSCKIRNLVTKEEKSSGNARIIVVGKLCLLCPYYLLVVKQSLLFRNVYVHVFQPCPFFIN